MPDREPWALESHTISSSRPGMTNLADIQQLIKAGAFDKALAALQALKRDGADHHSEQLYMQAVCHRYLDEFEAAQSNLVELKQLTPGNARAFQEEGHLYKSVKSWHKALQAYQRACQYNPALIASFRGQVECLIALGQEGAAAQVAAHGKQVAALPKPLLGAMDLIAQGKLVKAESLCREFLKRVPHHIEAMRLLADIGVKLGVLDDAEFLLESAHKFSPDNRQVSIDYIQVLRKKQKFERAREQARSLLQSAPDNPQFKSIYAVESMQCGDFDEAIAKFDEVLAQIPNDPITLTSKGHALKTTGRFDDAVRSYQNAARAKPGHGEAYYSLANLKRYRFTDAERQQMLELEHSGELDFGDQIFLQFALGKAFEDLEDFNQAFQHYARGNALKLRESRYDQAKMTSELLNQVKVCGPGLFEKHKHAGHKAPDPIFIVGLPRAGSTLLEQILSSHSQVDGTMELPNILSLAHKLRRGKSLSAEPEYPDCLHELEPEQLQEFGNQFIEETRIHRAGAPFFIDKMPNNFRHIGLIKLILPNAKIIDARREPMSCCFSGFKQLFAEGQEFTYSLSDIGRYYQDYVALMDHWDEVLPGAVLRVQHEDVVADLAGQVWRMLDYCGLPFEQACVDYHKTERSVRTPSSEQVRQPIFTTALEQWRNFEPYLEPLKTALAEPSPLSNSPLVNSQR